MGETPPLNKYDLDKDGVVEKDEADLVVELKEIEMMAKKQTAQRKMALTALISMIVFTIILMLPIIPESRLKLMGEVSSMFYIAMAGIVGAYMGMSAWMARR